VVGIPVAFENLSNTTAPYIVVARKRGNCIEQPNVFERNLVSGFAFIGVGPRFGEEWAGIEACELIVASIDHLLEELGIPAVDKVTVV
jgi:hypothetical protein